MKVAIYTRVSTEDQSVKQQLKELEEYCQRQDWKDVKEYVDDGVSALKKKRLAFLELMEDVRKRKVDLVLVWKLDRLSRSLKELVETIEFFNQCNVKFVSYTQAFLDTTNSSGKLMFAIFSAVAEFERDLISERTKLKLRYLKEKGVKLGRPRKIDYEQMKQLRQEGASLKQIAREIGVSKQAISQALAGVV